MLRLSFVAWVWFAAAAVAATAAAQQVPAEDLPAAVVRQHAAHCFRLHRDCAERAVVLQQAVHRFLAAPDAAGLAAAKAAWCDARTVYGQVEALRFHGGPIDELEPLLNAWPVDEAFIDRVAGRPEAGIVQDRRTYPTLNAEVLQVANQRRGEVDVSVGWHAIEFLLWGQDLDAHGPGARPWTDYAGEDPAVARRRSYLAIVTDLQVRHLAALQQAWAPDQDNFRRRFEADVPDALRRMLTGTAILTAFELCGERLAVAYETQDQEQEHSCFSDTTCADLVANQLGLVAVFRAGDGGADLLALVRSKDAAIGAHLEQCLQATLRALQAIPAPFDQAFRGPDDAPGRRTIHAAMQALDQQAEAIAIAGRLLGFDLPMRPGD